MKNCKKFMQTPNIYAFSYSSKSTFQSVEEHSLICQQELFSLLAKLFRFVIKAFPAYQQNFSRLSASSSQPVSKPLPICWEALANPLASPC